MSAKILVWGATGFTGRLVTSALRQRGLSFAVGGRSREKVEKLAQELGGVEAVIANVDDLRSIEKALEGREVVCAVAGPFGLVGEPVFATAARRGVHYLDTTGEQDFVLKMASRYREAAESSGAAMLPAFAYEIALADWAASLAASELGKRPERIDIVYSALGADTSRGTRLSMARMTAEGGVFLDDGSHKPERVGGHVRTFSMPWGEATGASFPSPEVYTVPRHTGADSVRVYMAAPKPLARFVHLSGPVLKLAARAAAPVLPSIMAKTSVGPDDTSRARARFTIRAEARAGGSAASATLLGADPYGITAAIIALGADRLLREPKPKAGVLAASELVEPRAAIEDLANHGFPLEVLTEKA